MEMVATVRFRRMHERVAGSRPYTDRLAAIVADLANRMDPRESPHPLLREAQEPERTVLTVLTSDRGLCGSYNANVLRLALERRDQWMSAGDEVLLHVAGRRGIQHLRFRGIAVERTIADFGQPADYGRVAAMADEWMADFVAGRVGALEIAYTQFLSAGRQKAAIAQVLPLSTLPLSMRFGPPTRARRTYDYLPSARAVLERLLPATVRLRVYQCFLDAAVSEQVARMTAMRAATDSADKMLHRLTVQYNRMRQAQITSELAEIMGGREGREA